MGSASAMAPTDTIAFSCVIDDDPILVAQCYIWLNCLLKLQSVPARRIFVHVVGGPAPDFVDWLRTLGVNLVTVAPFDARSAHCNKLRQLETFAHQTEFDRICLMDCDTAWVGDMAFPFASPRPLVMAKIVDYPNPPEPALRAIFQAASLGEPDWVPVSGPTEGGIGRTDRNYCNGGLYVLDRSILPRLAAAWPKWARWCLDHSALLGEAVHHADQLSLALALREMGVATTLLPTEWNYPTHLPAAQLPDITPRILHFHRQLTPHFRLRETGVARPDAVIRAFNEQIPQFHQAKFLNSVFWDLRYRLDPQLGSGLGSRGDALQAKRTWLANALASYRSRQVADVGCGDLEATRELPLQTYTGLDISEQALRIAARKRPDWRFVRGELTDQVQADAVICLDVLLHQTEAAEFDRLIRLLTASTRERLIVSGFERQPSVASDIIAYHRPIVEALRQTGAFAEICVLGRYRDVSLVVADKPRQAQGAHPNDMPAADFNLASTLTPRPDLLRCLVDLSREAFGFYTRQFSRAIEYPWVVDRLSTVPADGTFVDVGAGLNPIPLFLAERGATVHCLDPHPLERVPPATADWNEWGFFDYAWRHPGLHSYRLDAVDFRPPAAVDAVYSVSVIEHLPREHRERLLRACHDWLKPYGRLVLTLDLVPFTQRLWNFAEGREVEPAHVHGDVASMLQMLHGLGFRVLDKAIRRRVPNGRTDLLLLDCVRR